MQVIGPSQWPVLVLYIWSTLEWVDMNTFKSCSRFFYQKATHKHLQNCCSVHEQKCQLKNQIPSRINNYHFYFPFCKNISYTHDMFFQLQYYSWYKKFSSIQPIVTLNLEKNIFLIWIYTMLCDQQRSTEIWLIFVHWMTNPSMSSWQEDISYNWHGTMMERLHIKIRDFLSFGSQNHLTKRDKMSGDQD